MKKKMSIDVRIIESLNEFIEVEKIWIKHANNYNERKVLKRPQGLQPRMSTRIMQGGNVLSKHKQNQLSTW